MPAVGHLGDTHELSERARQYANDVIFGDEWSLTPDHINLNRVTFETSTRMQRQHGDDVTIQVSTEEEADLTESINGEEHHYKLISGVRSTLEDALNVRDLVTEAYSR